MTTMFLGTWGNISFDLTVDTLDRFSRLELELRSAPLAELDYSYTLERFPPVPAVATKKHADLDFLPVSEQASNRLHPVALRTMSDAVKPDELEIRFLDSSGKILRNRTFDKESPEPFLFRWTDINDDGFVDRGDEYEFRIFSGVKQARVWDRWAGEYVDTPRLVMAPGPGTLAGFGVMLAGAVAARLRRAAP